MDRPTLASPEEVFNTLYAKTGERGITFLNCPAFEVTEDNERIVVVFAFKSDLEAAERAYAEYRHTLPMPEGAKEADLYVQDMDAAKERVERAKEEEVANILFFVPVEEVWTDGQPLFAEASKKAPLSQSRVVQRERPFTLAAKLTFTHRDDVYHSWWGDQEPEISRTVREITERLRHRPLRVENNELVSEAA